MKSFSAQGRHNQPATPPGAAVETIGLCRSYGKLEALRNIDLKIPVGSVFGLIGLNGAGKTTLIRHLTGSLRPQSGTIRVLGGDPIADPEGVLKRVGYLTEEDSLPNWIRVGELIDFSRALYPSWDDRYANELIDAFGLSRHSRLGTLSKGVRARAGLLIAIAHRPELLLLDEPSSGLDPIARNDILEAVIQTINEEGRTVLFSSHLLEEVERVCDIVALLHQGRIIETLTVEQMENRYEEIICRPKGARQPITGDSTIFGWVRLGDEWSAVTERTEHPDAPPLEQRVEILERRPITMSRWFSARVGRESSDRSHSLPSVPEQELISDG